MSQWAEIRQMHVVDGVPKKQIAERLGLGYQDGAPGGGAGDGATSGVATPVIWIGGVRRSSSGCGRIVD